MARNTESADEGCCLEFYKPLELIAIDAEIKKKREQKATIDSI